MATIQSETIEDVRRAVFEAAAQIEEEAQKLRTDCMKRIEEIKNNEILKAINALNLRLDDIEARLPPPEEE